ncbi:MAG TPA: ComEC/Rec2 family competence protein [Candidatus Binatia bacterium]|jgi:competence protein ComEC|nr:ComEC/Rec2 family competence protein [Candidatus Binatia bacterium]
MLDRIARSPSKTLLVLLGAFVAGVAAHAFDERQWLEPLLSVAAAAIMVPIGFAVRSRAWRLVCAALALAVLGVARYDAALPVGPVAERTPPARAAWFTGTVAEEPRDSLKGTVLVMDRVFVSGGGAGERAVLSFRAPVAASPGDRLSWRCRMRTRDPATRGQDRDAAWSCFPDAVPRVISAAGWNAATGLLGAKRGIRSLAGALLPEPDASLLLGLLIGDRGGIPPDLVADFRATGTSHVLAVSGYNVHQVVELAFVLCAACAVKRRRASWIVAGLLVFFVALTGGDAPVVRAAVMGGMGLVAGLIGRRNAGLGPLAVAAALMLAHDPLILRHDVGFRLSFAAVAGMRAFGPLIAARLTFLPAAFGVRSAAADTLAATAGTLPIALHDFGLLPFASPLVNVAIAPLIPLIMAAGAAAMAVGALAVPLAAPLAFACEMLSRLMLGIVGASASVAPVLEARATAAEAAVLYAALALLRFGLGRPRVPRTPAPDPGVAAVRYDP